MRGQGDYNRVFRGKLFLVVARMIKIYSKADDGDSVASVASVLLPSLL